MKIVTVQDLINELNKVSDKSKSVFAYVPNYDINQIDMIDELDDRVDININGTQFDE